jgi:hypothetical protein
VDQLAEASTRGISTNDKEGDYGSEKTVLIKADETPDFELFQRN